MRWLVRGAALICFFVVLAPVRSDAVTVDPPNGGTHFKVGDEVVITGHDKAANTSFKVWDGGGYDGCFPDLAFESAGDWSCVLNGPWRPGTYNFEMRSFDGDNTQIGAGIPFTFVVATAFKVSKSSYKFSPTDPIRITGAVDPIEDVSAVVTSNDDRTFHLDLACSTDDGAFTCVEPSGATTTSRSARPAVLPIGSYAATITENDSEIGVMAQSVVQMLVQQPGPPNQPPTPTPTPTPHPTPTPSATPTAVAEPPVVVTTPTPTPTPSPTATTPSTGPVPLPLPPVPPPTSPPASPTPPHHAPALPYGVMLAALVTFGLARGVGFARQRVLPASGETAPITETEAPSFLMADASDDDLDREIGHGGREGWGDRSRTWRFPGHGWADRFGLLPPTRISPRTPLVGRLLADAAYLRAILGIAWLGALMAGIALGVAALVDTSARPVPPAVPLVIALVVVGFLDALAGAVAFLVYAVGVLVTGGVGDSAQPGVRGSFAVLIVLSLLWMALPMIGSATRPFRRLTTTKGVYAWDRVADAVVAATLTGWLAYNLTLALEPFVGHALAITADADVVGWVTAGGVVLRVVLEELSERAYPTRLRQVEKPGSLPGPSRLVDLGGGIFRTAVFLLLASLFLGNCWQLWVGTAFLGVWQLLAPFKDKLPKSRRLGRVLPAGVVKIFVMILIGYTVKQLAADDLSGLDLLRSCFVAVAVPPSVLTGLSLFGEDVEPVRWNWPAQLLGAALFVGCIVLTLSL